MSEELKIIQNEDGTFSEYDDTFDIMIHCQSEEEQNEVLAKLNAPQPCGDCISREAALDDSGLGEFHRYDDYVKMRNYLKSLPSVTPQPKMGRWISVSERLPEENDVYLVAVNSWGCPTRDVDGFMDHTDRKWEVYGNKVIAWMPLPKPYQPEIPTEAEGSEKE